MRNQSMETSVLSLALFVVGLIWVPMYSASAQTNAEREPVFGDDRSEHTIFVVNSPSAASEGTDSILTFDARGYGTVFFGAKHNLMGLRDIACDPKRPRHIFVPHSVFPTNSGMLIFDASGHKETVPSGTPGVPVTIAFDQAGDLYTATLQPDLSTGVIYKNDTVFANLPITGIGQIAVDRNGNVYLTDPAIASRIFHIDQAGKVTVFADASKGLTTPIGLAIDSRNNLFVANNPGSSPAFILKFDPSGTVTSFATNISFQPSIRSMTFGDDDNLYATLQADDTVLKFDRRGKSSVFANATDGVHNPVAVTTGTCPVDGRDREGEWHLSEEP
jgi:DNA-binding beta-propeller fold protein YncE